MAALNIRDAIEFTKKACADCKAQLIDGDTDLARIRTIQYIGRTAYMLTHDFEYRVAEVAGLVLCTSHLEGTALLKGMRE